MNIPPPKCPPPVTDFMRTPSISTDALSYASQCQVEEAPIGSMIDVLSTSGSGCFRTYKRESASTLTRVSLYLKNVPGSWSSRFTHCSGVWPRGGRSAQSGFPHNVPDQSLVCRRRCSHVIGALCAEVNRSTPGGM